MPENAPAALNGFIIHISLPALIILYVHHLPLDVSIFYPVAAPWLLFGLGLIVLTGVGRLAHWPASVRLDRIHIGLGRSLP